MKRRDFLKFIGVFPATLLVRRLPWQGIELPAIEEHEIQGLQPIDDWTGDEELCFETHNSFSYSCCFDPNGYPYRMKLSKRIRYAWEKLRWKVHNRLHGEDWYDDD